MFSLSRESEHELTHGILELIEKYHKVCNRVPQKITGMMNRTEVKEELKISDNTLNKWERQGFRRLQPPDEGSRTIFYLVDDIRRFMGVENGKN